MAKSYETDYIKVSAKSSVGVNAMFASLASKIIKKEKIKNEVVREDYTTKVVLMTRNRPEPKRECCNVC